MVGVRICKKPRQEASAQKVAPFASLLTVAVSVLRRASCKLNRIVADRPGTLHSNVRFWPTADLIE